MRDYITIFGRQVRVECNWNAIMAFMEATGTDLSALEHLTNSQQAALLVACVREGQRMDGESVDFTIERFGELRTREALRVIGAFWPIFEKQNAGDPESEAEAKKD